MKILFLIFNAFFVSFASPDPSIGWYSGSVWENGVILQGGSKGDSWFNGGIWSIRNWNTGSQWNINSIWGPNTSGITYSLLSNMSNWSSLPKTFNVTYNNISNCSTWNTFKTNFRKNYANNQTQELIR
jgi:hypothetical protein